MQRRDFLRAAAVAGVAAVTPELIGEAPTEAAAPANSAFAMQYRTLGRTGEKVSAIGLGGYHVGVQHDPAPPRGFGIKAHRRKPPGGQQ